MYRYILFILLVIATINFAYSQDKRGQSSNGNDYKGVIKGQVLEIDSHKPMSYAQISVYNVGNDKLVNGTIAEKDGNFSITNLPNGKYYLMIKFIGYEKKKVNSIVISEGSPVYNLGKIELNFSTYKSEGVEVTAEKPLVEFKMDKKIVNVNRDIISQGGTAVDALQNVPSVKVDVEGNVTLRGSSNFTVFINGKPSVLTGSDALEQIHASSIENIEIITNPSAKNDPDGVAGIINIILKKDTDLGLSGVFDLSVGTRDKYSTNLLLNYQMRGFRFFGGFDYSDDTRNNQGNSQAIYYLKDSVTKDLNSKIDGKRKHSGNTFKAGFGLDLNDASSISLEGNYGGMEFARIHNLQITQSLTPANLDSFFIDNSTGTRDNSFYSLNLNYFYNFDKKGHQLSAMAFYSSSDGTGKNPQRDYISDSLWNKISMSNNNINSREDETSYDYRIKVDYTLPINEDDKFEAGYQLRSENEDDKYNLQQFIVDSNKWVNNSLFSNALTLNENIHAIYGTYGSKFGSFSFLAGLRGEYTLRKIDVPKADKIYKIDRFDIFPSLHLVQDLGQSQQITASYSRRVERPSGWDLDLFPSYMNSYTYRIGNPELGPEFTDSYELGYQKYFGASYVSLESYYRVTSDKISRVRDLDSLGMIRLTSANLNKDYTLGVELTVNYEPFKWLRLNASTSYYNYRLEGQVFGEDIAKKTDVWDANFNVTLMLSPDTRLQTNGFYSGPTITAQGNDYGRFSWNAALRQDFWNKQASLTLQVRDILGTMKREFSSKDAYLYNKFYMDFESPVVSLAFSYKLNNYQKKKEPTNKENGMGDEGY